MSDIPTPPTKRSFKSLVAEMLDGRAWSDLDNLEGAVFDRLQDDGHLRTVRGIVVWTPITALSQAALHSRHNAIGMAAGAAVAPLKSD